MTDPLGTPGQRPEMDERPEEDDFTEEVLERIIRELEQDGTHRDDAVMVVTYRAFEKGKKKMRWNRHASYENNMQRIIGWLRRAVRFAMKNEERSWARWIGRARQETYAELALQSSPEVEVRDELLYHSSNHSSGDLALALAVRGYGYTPTEVGEFLGLSPAAVRKRLSRAFPKLER